MNGVKRHEDTAKKNVQSEYVTIPYSRIMQMGFVLLIIIVIVMGYIIRIDLNGVNDKNLVTADTAITPTASPTVTQPSTLPLEKRPVSKTPVQWQEDAYLVAVTSSSDLASTGYANAEVYASHKTEDIFLRYLHCCGQTRGIEADGIVEIITKEFIDEHAFHIGNAYDDVIDLRSLENAEPLTEKERKIRAGLFEGGDYDDKTKSWEEPLVGFSFPKDKGPHVTRITDGVVTYASVDGKRFLADRWTVQVTKSKEKGLIYTIIFNQRTQQVRVNGELVLSEKGDILGLTTY